ncbi:MAG: putative lipid II flippase FtsW [Verrucomicrobiae bacterium]|nr:putative lipid II flippase FtsW [Verrucomicrobiae bacterium]
MRKTAVILLLATLLLVAIGVVMLFSTSALYAREKYGDPNYLLKRQLVWLIVAAGGCVAAATVPYPLLRKWSVPLLVLAGLLLVLVLMPQLGRRIGGARRWLVVGSLQVQPSEFAKLALIVWLAHYLAREKRRIDRFGRGFLVPMGVSAVFVCLILAEPDFGTSALVGLVAFGMLFIAGVRLAYLVPAALGALGAFAVLIWRDPVRAERMLAFLDLEKYKAGKGYQVWQAILAFGSGGVNGLGLGNSRQKMFWLPEAHTDFIAAIIGEELGLIGMLVVLGLFAAVLGCGVVIALRTPDLNGQYLALGIVLLIALQTLINIGVVTAWLPTKGLPLPFISYGGSSLLVNLVSVGLLLSVLRYGTEQADAETQEFFAHQQEVLPL